MEWAANATWSLNLNALKLLQFVSFSPSMLQRKQLPVKDLAYHRSGSVMRQLLKRRHVWCLFQASTDIWLHSPKLEPCCVILASFTFSVPQLETLKHFIFINHYFSTKRWSKLWLCLWRNHSVICLTSPLVINPVVNCTRLHSNYMLLTLLKKVKNIEQGQSSNLSLYKS